MTTTREEIARQFEEVQRLAHLGSWEWDVLTDSIAWSDELYRIYGLEPQEFPATYEAFLERIHPDDRNMVNETVQAAYGSKEPYSFDHRLVRPDGSVRWLHGRGRVVADDNGNVVRLYGVAIDITEEKELANQQQEFIANAAHELRTPITAIVSAIQIIRDADGPPDASIVDILDRNSNRLLGVIESLLDLSALSGESRSMALTAVPVRAAVEAVASSLGLEVRVDVDDDLQVQASEPDLERVFVNLLSNAHRHGGPHIEVHGRAERDEVIIDVTDDGPGIAAELRPRLFSPFASKGSASGTHGLGLAIVDQLMSAFGGSVSHHDRAGGGTIFRLRFSLP